VDFPRDKVSLLSADDFGKPIIIDVADGGRDCSGNIGRRTEMHGPGRAVERINASSVL
jgi:hypothetical protein